MTRTQPVLPPALNGMLDRLLRANEEQARSSAALVEIQRQNAEIQKANGERLDSLNEGMRVQHGALRDVVAELKAMHQAREQAVEEIKGHVALGFSRSDRWTKILVAALGIFSAMLGAWAAFLLRGWKH